METKSADTKNSIIDEVLGASTIMFEGYHMFVWVDVLCCIDRVEGSIEFLCAAYESIDEKGGVCMQWLC